MTNYNLYKVFYYVAMEKNITRASEKLYISQPAISSSIKELEMEIGETLFDRKNKGVELTNFGKILFEKVEPIINKLSELDTLSKKYNNMLEGVLRIGSNTSNVNQLLLGYLNKFVKKFPNIKISIKRGNKQELINDLENNNLDIVFADYDFNDKKYQIVKEYEIRYQLIGNKKYKEKYGKENINVANFPINDLILPSNNNKSRQYINEFFEKYNVKLNPKYELDNYILLYDFVKNGYGMAFVNTEYYKKDIEKGSIQIIFPKLNIVARKIVCLTKSSSNLSLINFIKIINE